MPKSLVKEIKSKGEFGEALEDFDGLVVIDFFASWCGPCKDISPKFKKLAEKYSDCLFLKVNVDKAEKIADTCKIVEMPTFLFYKRGTKKGKLIGANEKKLEELIKKHK